MVTDLMKQGCRLISVTLHKGLVGGFAFFDFAIGYTFPVTDLMMVGLMKQSRPQEKTNNRRWW